MHIHVYQSLFPGGDRLFYARIGHPSAADPLHVDSVSALAVSMFRKMAEIGDVTRASISFEPPCDIEVQPGLAPKRLLPLTKKEQGDFWKALVKLSGR